MPGASQDKPSRKKTPQHVLDRKKAYYRENRQARLAYQKEYAENRQKTAEPAVLARMFQMAKSRAKRRGIEFTITKEWVFALAEEAQGRCQRTGLAFQYVKDSSSPWKPSLDRIDSSIGYVPNNVQLVCLVYNFAKNVWHDDDIQRFAQAMVDNTR